MFAREPNPLNVLILGFIDKLKITDAFDVLIHVLIFYILQSKPLMCLFFSSKASCAMCLFFSKKSLHVLDWPCAYKKRWVYLPIIMKMGCYCQKLLEKPNKQSLKCLSLQLRKRFFAVNRNLSCAGVEYIVFSSKTNFKIIYKSEKFSMYQLTWIIFYWLNRAI